MVEVRDNNSGAILFKKTNSEKKVDELEGKVRKLEGILETLLSKDKLSTELVDVSIKG